MADGDEIGWHRTRLVQSQTLLDELQATNEAGGEVFQETQAEIERLKAQMEQSRLIVAAYDKGL
jgi:hypothetical protein